MPTDAERLARRRGRPLLVELHHALTRLTSTLTVMNTGAHPDDEQSGLLALLRYGFGMHLVIACSTRGEGGQNSLGPERGGALGVVRTRELEEAARVLDADVTWLGFGPGDPVHDFGFSKSGADTLARWGRERLLERLVRAYRTERPDIVIPTFLDVPGQHGHHRAMTEAAEAAIALAADSDAYPEHFDEGLEPWQVGKYYLPAWGGGGGTYDDEPPPPNATVTVAADGPEAATGASFAEIGQWSRLFHATQGMGRWQAVPQTEWPLHLKSGPAVETDLRDGLPANLDRLADAVNADAAAHLRAAQRAIDTAIAAFPDRPAIVAALLAAIRSLEAADGALLSAELPMASHRLVRKRLEIDAAILLASGVTPLAWLDTPALSPGGAGLLTLHLPQTPLDLAVHPVVPEWVEVRQVDGTPELQRFEVKIGPDAPLSSPWQAGFSGLGGNGQLSLRLTATIDGEAVGMFVDLETPLSIVPAQTARLDPSAIILLLPSDRKVIAVAARRGGTLTGSPSLAPSTGLDVTATAGGFDIVPHRDLQPGHYRLPLNIDGEPAYAVEAMSYPHIGAASYATPQGLDVLALDLKLPKGARIGYVGGGADRVGSWLERMGCDVGALGNDDLGGDLTRYTTIVVGIFAFGRRPDLAAAAPRLRDWVHAGGHLVTLYHRPGDGWNPDTTPPARLVIGSPSLRWRVTDPNAEVTVLAPDHPLLKGPNRIGNADWAGWDKERGLYFAAEWDPAYVPLLAMHDAGEAPLTGGLLSARLGRGRHTHVSLVLHHQMDRLVPGAFRLMANLVQSAADMP